MEGSAANIYRNLKGFWKRRGYQRLNIHRRKNPPELSRTTANPNRRRFWKKIRIVPKKLRFISPKKLFIGLRDAYVNFMLRLATSSAVAGGGADGYGVSGFGMRAVKEYDEKVVVEIYKSIVMNNGKLVVRDGPDNNYNSRVANEHESK